ncbi:uncharacterized protein LOC128964337 [Oppia nitens]|uniref:uncharacterized protein LOC128964337 n=1 Tax=Oppia nitens TaxID=1686743 RepID=UPI0023DB6140|nr:uncharacterized protein LOC128964337 [Oppia nitens]
MFTNNIFNLIILLVILLLTSNQISHYWCQDIIHLATTETTVSQLDSQSQATVTLIYQTLQQNQCYKQTISDIKNCTKSKASDNDFELYHNNRIFQCCQLAIEFDCSLLTAKTKCNTILESTLKLAIDNMKYQLNNDNNALCKGNPIETGRKWSFNNIRCSGSSFTSGLPNTVNITILLIIVAMVNNYVFILHYIEIYIGKLGTL